MGLKKGVEESLRGVPFDEGKIACFDGDGDCVEVFCLSHFRSSFFFPLEEERDIRSLSRSLALLPPPTMAANLASDPRKPPPLPLVALPASAPRSSVAETLLRTTDALADAAESLLPRLRPDPDNRRPPLSFADAQSISQSRADERRCVQARKEKAGKASAKAFAIGLGGVGVGGVGKGGGDGASIAAGVPTGGSSQPLPHHPHHGVGSEFPGAVPEGESEKAAYWTFVQVRLRGGVD